jgi:hypothetical protein
MISTGFPQALSMAKTNGSNNIGYGLLASSSRRAVGVARYAGLSRADLSEACVARFHSKYNKTADCWLWQAGRYHHGYGMVSVGRKGGRQRNSYAHRVAYVLAKGPIPRGLVVMHACDNRACVNPAHLSLGTQGDNVRDAARKGHYSIPHPTSSVRKLSDGDVRAIRMSFASGDALARCYGVSKSTISFIRRGLRRAA